MPGLQCGSATSSGGDDSLEKNLRSPHSHAAFFDNANKDAAAGGIHSHGHVG